VIQIYSRSKNEQRFDDDQRASAGVDSVGKRQGDDWTAYHDSAEVSARGSSEGDKGTEEGACGRRAGEGDAARHDSEPHHEAQGRGDPLGGVARAVRGGARGEAQDHEEAALRRAVRGNGVEEPEADTEDGAGGVWEGRRSP